MREDINSAKVFAKPNEITKEELKRLKKANIKTIELEAWATNDYILKKCDLGYTYEDIKKASQLIKWNRLRLVYETVVGLPESTRLDEIRCAKELARFKPKEVKIYPVIVTKGSKLEKELDKGEYKPLTLMQSIERCKEIIYLLSRKKVNIISVENNNIKKKDIIEGPYHPEFVNLVNDSIWYDSIVDKIKKINMKIKKVEIKVNFVDLNNALGYQNENIKKIKEIYDVDVVIKADNEIKQGKCQLKILQTYDEYADFE